MVKKVYQFAIKLRLMLCVWLLLGWINPHLLASESGPIADEDKLRAAIVLGIVRFTSWPEDVQKHKNLYLCTLGKPLSSKILVNVSGQHKYRNQPIIATVLEKKIFDASDCNVLVLGNGIKPKTLQKILPGSDAHAVLTICDGCKKGIGSMVHLMRTDNRIGFKVNLELASEAGLNFRSALLEIASEVKK